MITPAVRELRRRYPEADIGTRHLECHEEDAFTHGQVDMRVARAPLFIPTDEARVGVLYEEPRMLVLAAEHPLAGEDWATYDRVMAEQRRAAVLITPTRVYSN